MAQLGLFLWIPWRTGETGLSIYCKLINGEGLKATSAFSMKLFGIMVGADILSQLKISSNIYLDFEASMKCLHRLSSYGRWSDLLLGMLRWWPLRFFTFGISWLKPDGLRCIQKGTLETQITGRENCEVITYLIELLLEPFAATLNINRLIVFQTSFLSLLFGTLLRRPRPCWFFLKIHCSWILLRIAFFYLACWPSKCTAAWNVHSIEGQ